jgi:hypothetical protein
MKNQNKEKELKDNNSNDPYYEKILPILSASLFSVGIVMGIRRVFRKENEIFKLRNHAVPAIIGIKALGIASLLCVGVFGAFIGVFSVSTGIYSASQLSEAIHKRTDPLKPPIPEIDQESQKELDEMSKSVEQLLGQYFSKDK